MSRYCTPEIQTLQGSDDECAALCSPILLLPGDLLCVILEYVVKPENTTVSSSTSALVPQMSTGFSNNAWSATALVRATSTVFRDAVRSLYARPRRRITDVAEFNRACEISTNWRWICVGNWMWRVGDTNTPNTPTDLAAFGIEPYAVPVLLDSADKARHHSGIGAERNGKPKTSGHDGCDANSTVTAMPFAGCEIALRMDDTDDSATLGGIPSQGADDASQQNDGACSPGTEQQQAPLSFARGASCLRVEMCDNISSLEGAQGIPDVSIVACPQVVDVSPLADALTVHIGDCHGLPTVAPLRYVPRLTLRFCYSLTSLEGLDVVDLDDDACGGSAVDGSAVDGSAVDGSAVDGSAVGDGNGNNRNGNRSGDGSGPAIDDNANDGGDGARARARDRCLCQWISVAMCPIDDVNPLRHMTTVSLLHCNYIVDVSSLSNVDTLVLSQCQAIESVGALGKVRRLTLCSLALTTIEGLGLGNQEVIIDDCIGIRDVACLGTVRRLTLRDCPRVRDVSRLGSVPDLDFTNCDGVRPIAAIACREIAIRDRVILRGTECEDSDILALGPTRYLDLSWCANITPLACDALATNAADLEKCTLLFDGCEWDGVDFLGLARAATHLSLRSCICLNDDALIAMSQAQGRRVQSINVTGCERVKMRASVGDVVLECDDDNSHCDASPDRLQGTGGVVW